MGRRRAEPTEVTFTLGDSGGVEAAMGELASTGGWLNLRPLVDEEDLPDSPRGLVGLLAAKVPPLPVGTWVPGGEGRSGPEPDQVGLQHPLKRKALVQLDEAGLTRPTGWVRKQDHPTRGIVMEAPHGTSPREVLAWLTAAIGQLSPVPLDGTFRASLHDS